MTHQPLVSVVMNCYNGEKYLGAAIESVLAQTYENWEIIFWDNQSTDRSAEIAQSYRDPRIKYFYASEHSRLYAARNYAIDRATGDFLAFLDVDDWWLPTKLERQLPLFTDPRVGFVCGNYWVKSERKQKQWLAHRRRSPSGWILNDLLKSYFIGLLTLMIRRSALDGLAYACDPRFHIIGDLDLVVRLSIGWQADCVQEPVGVYRLHDGNATAKQRTRHIHEVETWWREIQRLDAVRTSPNAHLVEQSIAYQKAVDRVLSGDWLGAVRLSRRIQWGHLKIRLLGGLMVPTALIQRIKN